MRPQRLQPIELAGSFRKTRPPERSTNSRLERNFDCVAGQIERAVEAPRLRDPRDPSSDARDDSLRHLRDEGLIRTVSLDGRERAVTQTTSGRRLLDAHRRDGGEASHQAGEAETVTPI